MQLALDGIRILDMAWVGPGPFCATILGDLGADVIKIHEPYPDRRGGLVKYALPDSPEFPGLRNCKTIGLNLKSEEGRDIFYKLARSADAIMESFRPGVMARLGVDYNTIKDINPAIVYASLTGFGQNGPYRDIAGHDIDYIAIGGLLGLTGTDKGPPVAPGTLVADLAAGGMSAAIGILAALMSRHTSGKGQFIDVSITDGIVQMMSLWINPYLVHGIEYERGRTMFTGQNPWYNVYETKDGKYLVVGAFEHWFYVNLCHILGCEEYIEHQFSDEEKQEEISQYFKKTFLTRTRDEWMEILSQKDTCSAPVYSIEEVATDPQVLARCMVQDMPHPILGSVKQVGSMLKLSDSPFQARNWSTRFGQHTDEILSDLGFNSDDINTLRKSEIIS